MFTYISGGQGEQGESGLFSDVGCEMSGFRLDMTHPFWEVSGKTDFSSLLAALPDLLPGECVLFFEGGSPTGELVKFLQEHEIPERLHIAYGTIWPKPLV